MEYISPKGGRSVALDEVQSNLATLLRETRPEMPPRDATIMAYWLASEDPAADVLVDLNKILLDTEELAERLGRTTIHAARVARDRQNVLLHPVVEKGQYRLCPKNPVCPKSGRVAQKGRLSQGEDTGPAGAQAAPSFL